ncbi:FAD-dependent thymidylate synthase [Candidatus Woesearchaeota archaeon]|nr:FAD-dependent thymidylate synthase [Candidatus Woesearchaeota archaeon]
MVSVKLAGMNAPLKVLEELKILNAELRQKTSFSEQDLRLTADIDSVTVKELLQQLKLLIGKVGYDYQVKNAKLMQAYEKTSELIERFTPEPISAAYARISRDPSDVNELLDKALLDVAKAKKSNEAIIFGLGHHSVADHALFNFNITGISRLAIEDFEKRRIGVGYTEKSQRYIKMKGDYVKPKEFTPEDLKKFEALVAFQNDFYFRNNEKLFEFLQKKFSDKIFKMDDDERKDFISKLNGSAKEDARYSLCLATEGQLGCSYNGEALEHMIRNGKYSRLLETRDAVQQFFDQVVAYAPSLIQLADADVFRKHNPGLELKEDNFKYTEQTIRELVQKTFSKYAGSLHGSEYKFLSNRLCHVLISGEDNVKSILSEDHELNILAAVLHEYSSECIENCYEIAHDMRFGSDMRFGGDAYDFVKQALKHLSQFDKVPRAFEFTGGLMYEAIVSSSCFAQLKRHRMMTLLSQDYNPELGFTIPQNIEEAGMAKELEEVMKRSSDLYYEFLPKYGKPSEYCLTNAHKRRVLMSMNMRQLYHFSRTREDAHAQWEIRGLANTMADLASDEAPITGLLLGGQHEFNEVYQKIYNPVRDIK